MSESTSASTNVMPSSDPMYLTSFEAEVWLRTMARTFRLLRSAAVTAEKPMLPVEPTTKTVSLGPCVMVLGEGGMVVVVVMFGA